MSGQQSSRIRTRMQNVEEQYYSKEGKHQSLRMPLDDVLEIVQESNQDDAV